MSKDFERTSILEASKEVAKEVKLLGWVDNIRDHGKVTFVDLRDRSGKIQCIGNKLPKLSVESVVEIIGKVKRRPEGLVNPKLETGKVEVEIGELNVISKSDELPIPIEGDGLDIEEGLRLKYRYLDLRRPRMSKNIVLRSKVTQFIRN